MSLLSVQYTLLQSHLWRHTQQALRSAGLMAEDSDLLARDAMMLDCLALDNENDLLLQNVGNPTLDTASHTRSPVSSAIPLGNPQISFKSCFVAVKIK